MSGGGTAPTAFTPPNQAGAASGLSGAANTLSGLGTQVQNTAIPGYQNIYHAVTSNPYYAGAQSNANATGAQGVSFGQGEVNNATGLQGLATSLGQYAPGIAATAFDPNNALYNQAYTQNMNQINTINAQNGLAGGATGAGIAGQSGQNFNLNWMAQQQARQNAGVAALGQLGQTQSGLATAAGDLGTSGLNNMQAGGQLPAQTYNAQQQSIEQALNALVQGDNSSGASTQAAGGLDNQYLDIGQQAATTNLQAFQVQQKADAAFWQAIASLSGTAAKALLGF